MKVTRNKNCKFQGFEVIARKSISYSGEIYIRSWLDIMSKPPNCSVQHKIGDTCVILDMLHPNINELVDEFFPQTSISQIIDTVKNKKDGTTNSTTTFELYILNGQCQ